MPKCSNASFRYHSKTHSSFNAFDDTDAIISFMRNKQILVVLGLLVNNKGEVLITKRCEAEDPDNLNKWEIPGGGIEFGEDPLVALKREMKEELGVEIQIITLLPQVKSTFWNDNGKKMQGILFCYLCKIVGKEKIVLNSESSAYQWIKPKEINKYKYLPHADTFIYEAEQLMKKM